MAIAGKKIVESPEMYIVIEKSGVGMNFYAAVFVYESSSSAAECEPLYEETVAIF